MSVYACVWYLNSYVGACVYVRVCVCDPSLAPTTYGQVQKPFLLLSWSEAQCVYRQRNPLQITHSHTPNRT